MKGEVCEAEIICKVIQLQDTGNHHGTTFYINDEDVQVITFKFLQNMSQSEVEMKSNKHFWYDKESKISSSEDFPYYNSRNGQMEPPLTDSFPILYR